MVHHLHELHHLLVVEKRARCCRSRSQPHPPGEAQPPRPRSSSLVSLLHPHSAGRPEMFLPEVGSQPDLTLSRLCHLKVWGSWLGAARGCERLILALWRRLVHNSPPTPSTEPAASRRPIAQSMHGPQLGDQRPTPFQGSCVSPGFWRHRGGKAMTFSGLGAALLGLGSTGSQAAYAQELFQHPTGCASLTPLVWMCSP